MREFLDAAIEAARAAGQLLRENFDQPLHINSSEQHDIKLEIDVRTQELITRMLLDRFPQHALYGEEGLVGDQTAEYQWVVDPLDGTVNYFYRIPHFCTSIALRHRGEIIIGVILDPMRNEMWTAMQGSPSLLNGREIRVSPRTVLAETIVSVGLSKTAVTIGAGLPLLQHMATRVRKCRAMGSAALDMAYVSCGRFDAYIEQGVSLWDIAAGALLIREAGGRVDLRPRDDAPDKFKVVAYNGQLEFGVEL
jgi:myo-inositol-1(or 4)-monophosphatase